MVYMNDEKLWDICMDIYREAYEKSEPSADFDKLIESGEARQPHFFMKYYLPEETLQKIIDKHTKKLSKLKKHVIEKEVLLGCTPTSVKDNWYKRERKAVAELTERLKGNETANRM